MAKIENGWFYEFIKVYHGQAMSLQIEDILVHQESKFQDILVFKSKDSGNVLVLDGCIQVVNKDEFVYQEMIAYLPLNSHPNPKKVLVIGAGDGGVIREVTKHPSVECIIQCEIDERTSICKDVVKVCKEYLPKLACGYDSPKHKLNIGCGKVFMKQFREEFDVIITDSSDSEGPGAALFQKEYFELIKSALKPDGIMCSEGECPWLDSRSIATVIEACKSIFPVVQYAIANVPTYPCGIIGFIMCSRNTATRFEQPVTKFNNEQLSSFNFQYYNYDVHKAAFALPQYFKEVRNDYDGSDEIENQNWFWQIDRSCSGQSFGLVKNEILLHEKTSQEHDVVIFKNSIYGNVMLVDDVLQYTENDQPLYEESLAHLALNSHPSAKKVLIIGGQSSGIVHEVAKHKAVENITLLQKDQEILDIAKKYFPRSAAGYNNSKMNVVYIDEYEDYLQKHFQEFDVIITVPDEVFFNHHVCELLRNALKSGGMCISKVPSFWIELPDIAKRVEEEKLFYPTVKMAYICIPTFPYGQATFVLLSLNQDTNFDTPLCHLDSDQISQMKFYNEAVHTASFAIPEFVRKALEDKATVTT